ncbi:hemerythrin [Azospira sp. I13]|uniref:bacteriohemerythrin n=1 Tax=Azospira sp. I13 TaxID=1765050 RepID=UPI000D439D18|nr:bacteriohemerythrin [Azospira sp. I13]GBG03784.1 hemerythrin [Azospira sp. I13]
MGAKEAVIVAWNDAYSVGMQAIDEQHQALFTTINRLWSAIIGKGSQEQVSLLITELEQYTKAHFAAEEAFMDAAGYPGLPEHKELHRTFVSRIAAERQKVSEGKTISLDLLHFLKDWLVEHIQVQDQRYAAHCRQNRQQKEGGGLSAFFKRFWN